MPILVLAVVAAYIAQHPGWLQTRVPGRDFSPWQRQLTEFRVLASYLRQTVFPDIAQFGLYHDDVIISQTWTSPPTTLWSALLHLGLLGIAVVSIRRFPLVALGVGWFYMGHLLESTVWPLELVHEHRNYLPMWGVMLALGYVFWRLTASLPTVRMPMAVLLLLVFSAVTLSRAHGLGGGVDYFLHEARLHPHSARANYDAASGLINVVRSGNGSLEEYGPQISAYLEASQTADSNALAPFLGKVILSIMEDRRAPDDLVEFERRLRYGVPPNAIHMIFVSLMDMVAQASASFTNDDLERLFVASLANPELRGIGRTVVQANYGMFLAGMKDDIEGAKNQLFEVLQRTPKASEVRLHYAGMLIESGHVSEAKVQIDIAKQFDTFGHHTEFADNLNRLAESRENVENR
jgi:hypothetical protein